MLNVESRSIMILVAAGLVWAATGQADPRPLKVFILAGQSNMEGPARIDTFDYIGDDPATAPLLKMMRGAVRVCTRISVRPARGPIG